MVLKRFKLVSRIFPSNVGRLSIRSREGGVVIST
jgi:hypothetical protein